MMRAEHGRWLVMSVGTAGLTQHPYRRAAAMICSSGMALVPTRMVAAVVLVLACSAAISCVDGATSAECSRVRIEAVCSDAGGYNLNWCCANHQRQDADCTTVTWLAQVHGPGCSRCTLNPPKVKAKQSRCTRVRNSHYDILGRHAGADVLRSSCPRLASALGC
jgi:hypothetical protein